MVTEDEVQTRCASSGDDSATIGSSFSPTLTDASSTPTDSMFITAPSPPPDLFTDMSKRKQRYCQVNLAVSPPGYNKLPQYSPYCPLTPLSPEFPSPAAFLRYPSNSEIDGVQQKSQRHSGISSSKHRGFFPPDAAAARRSLQSVVAASEMNFSMDRRPSVCSDSQDEGGGFSVDDAIEMYLDGFSDDPSPETEDHDHEMTDTADDRTDVSDQRSLQEPETEGFKVPEDWPLPNTYEDHSMVESLPNVHTFPDNTIMEDTVTNNFGAEKRRSYKPLASNPVLLNTEEVVHPNLAKRYSSVLAQKPCERLELPPNFPISQPPPLTRGTSTRDRYGFHKSSTSGVSSRAYDAWNQTYTPYLEARRKKWDEILENSGLSTDAPFTFPPKSRQMKRFIRKGIPPEYRGHAWFFYAGGDKIYHQNPGLYRRLVEEAWNSAMNDDKEHIERDLHRTFPDNVHFKPDFVETPDEHADGSDGQKIYEQSHLEPRIIQSLRRVLYAFALHNSKIGYTQSLNFIAGMLLLLLPEEKAFWMLHIITSRYLPATHEINLEGADVDLWILMVLLREQMPAVYAKIADTSPSTNRSKPPVMEESADLPVITLGLTNWLMSIFIGSLPWETTLRVWDIFFYEGSRTFFRVGLGIFKSCEKAILSVSDSSEIFQIVQKAPKRLLDANALIDECFVKKHHRISQQRVESLRNSRRRGLRAKKQRLSMLGSARNCGASEDYRPKTGHAWRSLRSHAFRS
ncbi:palmitoyltransferase swf1 [Ascosphaera pollenicola]|nr:palmitoyltransferase swf1 [Ascosphaera pollenicola]